MFYEESHFRLKVGSHNALDLPTWRAKDEAERLGKGNKKMKKKDVNGGSWECEDQLFHGSSIRVDLWKRIRTLDIYIDKDPNEKPKYRVWYLKVQCWLAVIAVDIFGESHSLDDLTVVFYSRTKEDSCPFTYYHNHILDPLAYLYGIKRFSLDTPSLSRHYCPGLKKAVTSDFRRVKFIDQELVLRRSKSSRRGFIEPVVTLPHETSGWSWAERLLKL